MVPVKSSSKANMLNGSIPTLILRVALPTTVALLSTSLFHVADAFFLSKLNTDAAAAVGVTFAIQNLIQALGYTFGTGGGSILARKLGKHNTHDASAYASVAFWFSLLMGGVISLFGLWSAPKLLPFLGASTQVYPHAIAYLQYFLWCAPAMCASFALSQLLRSEGKALYAMWGLAVGNLLNIALDPLLIFRLDLGIAGAGLATLISQWSGLLVLLWAYVFHKSRIQLFRLQICGIVPRLLAIMTTGLPSLLRQGLICVATILLNHAAAQVSDAAVAAMSVVNRIFLLTFSFCAGVGQGMMSVIGHNVGAEKWDRVKRAFVFALFLSTLGMLLIGIPLSLISPRIVSVFRKESDVVGVGGAALRAQMAILFCHGAITCVSMCLQAMGKSLSSSVVACTRQGIFFFPLILLIPNHFGLPAFIYVQPVADLLSFLFTIPFLISLLRQFQALNRKKAIRSG